MTVVCPPTGSSPPNLRKSSQFRATAMSSALPELSTLRVDTRNRKLDSPPRIWGPKLFVRMPWYPSSAAAVSRDSPADTMPSPPEPAMPMIRSLFIRAFE